MKMQSAEMKAQARVLKFWQNFLEELMEPMVKKMVRAKWASLSDDLKQEIMEKSPENYAAIMEYVNE